MADNAVGNNRITKRCLMVLMVEEFLGEELLELEPSARGVWRVAGLPIIPGFVHVGKLKERHGDKDKKMGWNLGNCIQNV